LTRARLGCFFRLVLVPIIYTLVGKKHRDMFSKFNWHFFLINIHVLNVPIALYNDWKLAPPRALTEYDLHIALWIALIYVLFYLVVVEGMLKLHFYIILSPRTHASPLVYLFCLSLYAAIYAIATSSTLWS
jgi:hypothetical protein